MKLQLDLTAVEARPRSWASLLGGGAGIVIGWLVTLTYARMQGWPVDIPLWVAAGGMSATLFIGGIAGLYPAIRAARMAPTEALNAA